MKTMCTVHGVMLEVSGRGLLITGAAGIGKSELGLALVCLGHRLVADDVVEFRRQGNDLIALRDPQYAGFVALRDLGVVNLMMIYGAAASTDRQRLDLILELVKAGAQTEPGIEDLGGRRATRRILDVEIPSVKLVADGGRPLAQLAEVAVRDQQARDRGYRADLDLEAKQHQRVEDMATWS